MKYYVIGIHSQFIASVRFTFLSLSRSHYNSSLVLLLCVPFFGLVTVYISVHFKHTLNFFKCRKLLQAKLHIPAYLLNAMLKMDCTLNYIRRLASTRL